MPVTLHQPVAGMDRGQTYSGPLEPWLLVNGYASRKGDNTSKTHLTGVESTDQDPQLAENREEPVDVQAQHLVPGAPSLDRELKHGGLAKGLKTDVEPVEDADLADRQAETLPPPRNLTVGAEADEDVEGLYRERYDQSKRDVEVKDAKVPEVPAPRNLTVGADEDSSLAQANVVLPADPNAAEETKPKVRRVAAKSTPKKTTDRALTEPRDEQPGELHGIEDAETDK